MVMVSRTNYNFSSQIKLQEDKDSVMRQAISW